MMPIREGLTFDDVLLIPKHSAVKTRSDVKLSVEISPGFKYKIPLIPANMSSITEASMAEVIMNAGGLSLVHRFMPMTLQQDMLKSLFELKSTADKHVGFSIGVKSDDIKNLQSFISLGLKIVCVDIAHGDSEHCIEFCKAIRK